MFVALELKKSEADIPSDGKTLQEHVIKSIERAKGIALFACPENWIEVYQMLLKISKGDISHVHNHRGRA